MRTLRVRFVTHAAASPWTIGVRNGTDVSKATTFSNTIAMPDAGRTGAYAARSSHS